MIDLVPGNSCVGCHAYETVCKAGAILMTEDREGFLFPCVDYNKCTKCEVCLVVCPALDEKKFERFENPQVFAAWSSNEAIREKSSSGGIFSELANATFSKKGIVFGAAFN